LSNDLAEKVKAELMYACSGLWPLRVSQKEAEEDLVKTTPGYDQMELKEKRNLIKQRQIKMRRTEMEMEKDNRLFIKTGLKQSLKALGSGPVAALLYDSDTNIGAATCIFDKGQFPICGLPGLSPFIKPVLGFNATVLTFTVDALKEGNKFNPLVKLLRQTGDFPETTDQKEDEPKAKRMKVDNNPVCHEETPDAAKGNFGDDFIKLS